VVITRQVDPPVLGGHERAPEHEAADDCCRQGVQACRLAGDERPLGREDIVGRASQRPPEIDEYVEAEKQEPDHRRRPVEPAGDLE
jgi:hypothetical protein